MAKQVKTDRGDWEKLASTKSNVVTPTSSELLNMSSLNLVPMRPSRAKVATPRNTTPACSPLQFEGERIHKPNGNVSHLQKTPHLPAQSRQLQRKTDCVNECEHWETALKVRRDCLRIVFQRAPTSTERGERFLHVSRISLEHAATLSRSSVDSVLRRSAREYAVAQSSSSTTSCTSSTIQSSLYTLNNALVDLIREGWPLPDQTLLKTPLKMESNLITRVIAVRSMIVRWLLLFDLVTADTAVDTEVQQTLQQRAELHAKLDLFDNTVRNTMQLRLALARRKLLYYDDAQGKPCFTTSQQVVERWRSADKTLHLDDVDVRFLIELDQLAESFASLISGSSANRVQSQRDKITNNLNVRFAIRRPNERIIEPIQSNRLASLNMQSHVGETERVEHTVRISKCVLLDPPHVGDIYKRPRSTVGSATTADSGCFTFLGTSMQSVAVTTPDLQVPMPWPWPSHLQSTLYRSIPAHSPSQPHSAKRTASVDDVRVANLETSHLITRCQSLRSNAMYPHQMMATRIASTKVRIEQMALSDNECERQESDVVRLRETVRLVGLAEVTTSALLSSVRECEHIEMHLKMRRAVLTLPHSNRLSRLPAPVENEHVEPKIGRQPSTLFEDEKRKLERQKKLNDVESPTSLALFTPTTSDSTLIDDSSELLDIQPLVIASAMLTEQQPIVWTESIETNTVPLRLYRHQTRDEHDLSEFSTGSPRCGSIRNSPTELDATARVDGLTLHATSQPEPTERNWTWLDSIELPADIPLVDDDTDGVISQHPMSTFSLSMNVDADVLVSDDRRSVCISLRLYSGERDNQADPETQISSPEDDQSQLDAVEVPESDDAVSQLNHLLPSSASASYVTDQLHSTRVDFVEFRHKPELSDARSVDRDASSLESQLQSTFISDSPIDKHQPVVADSAHSAAEFDSNLHRNLEQSESPSALQHRFVLTETCLRTDEIELQQCTTIEPTVYSCADVHQSCTMLVTPVCATDEQLHAFTVMCARALEECTNSTQSSLAVRVNCDTVSYDYESVQLVENATFETVRELELCSPQQLQLSDLPQLCVAAALQTETNWPESVTPLEADKQVEQTSCSRQDAVVYLPQASQLEVLETASPLSSDSSCKAKPRVQNTKLQAAASAKPPNEAILLHCTGPLEQVAESFANGLLDTDESSSSFRVEKINQNGYADCAEPILAVPSHIVERAAVKEPCTILINRNIDSSPELRTCETSMCATTNSILDSVCTTAHKDIVPPSNGVNQLLSTQSEVLAEYENDCASISSDHDITSTCASITADKESTKWLSTDALIWRLEDALPLPTENRRNAVSQERAETKLRLETYEHSIQEVQYEAPVSSALETPKDESSTIASRDQLLTHETCPSVQELLDSRASHLETESSSLDTMPVSVNSVQHQPVHPFGTKRDAEITQISSTSRKKTSRQRRKKTPSRTNEQALSVADSGSDVALVCTQVTDPQFIQNTVSSHLDTKVAGSVLNRNDCPETLIPQLDNQATGSLHEAGRSLVVENSSISQPVAPTAVLQLPASSLEDSKVSQETVSYCTLPTSQKSMELSISEHAVPVDRIGVVHRGQRESSSLSDASTTAGDRAILLSSHACQVKDAHNYEICSDKLVSQAVQTVKQTVTKSYTSSNKSNVQRTEDESVARKRKSKNRRERSLNRDNSSSTEAESKSQISRLHSPTSAEPTGQASTNPVQHSGQESKKLVPDLPSNPTQRHSSLWRRVLKTGSWSLLAILLGSSLFWLFLTYERREHDETFSCSMFPNMGISADRYFAFRHYAPPPV